jgi:type IV secretory pathway TrbD component
MFMAELRQVPIYRALNRPNLLMGGDRELVLVTILSTLFLIVLLASWYTVAIGAVVWFAGMWGVRWMAKADPLMRNVYLRHIKYSQRYDAKSGPFLRT